MLDVAEEAPLRMISPGAPRRWWRRSRPRRDRSRAGVHVRPGHGAHRRRHQRLRAQ